MARSPVDVMREEIAPLINLVFLFRLQHPQLDFARFRGEAEARLADFDARAKRGGLPPDSTLLVKKALAALLDETVQLSGWKGRAEWDRRTLGESQFGSRGLGDAFYDDLARVRNDASEVVEAYALCLVAGFRGRSVDRGSWKVAVQDVLRRLPELSHRMNSPITPEAQPEGAVDPVLYKPAIPKWAMWGAGLFFAASMALGVYYAGAIGGEIEAAEKAVDAKAPRAGGGAFGKR